MLQKLRSGAGSLIAKILLVLLIGAFGLWGVADYMGANSARGGAIATIGRDQITLNEFQTEYRRAIQALQAQMGQNFDPQQAVQMNLPENLLRDMIDRRLLARAADDMGIAVSDDALRSAIARIRAFHNAQGQFDDAVYQTILSQQSLTPAQFEAQMRLDLRVQQYLALLPSPLFIDGLLPAPQPAIDGLAALRGEERSAQFIVLRAPPAASLPDPSESEVTAYYDANKMRFTGPETRAVRWVALAPTVVIDMVRVEEAEIVTEYETVRAQRQLPERRNLEQVVFQDEASAQAAAALIRSGTSFAAMAQQTRNLKPDDIQVRDASRTQLPSEIADAVFALPQGGVSGPLKSPFGWHLIRVTSIQRSDFPPLAQVREPIRQGLLTRKAADLVESLRTKIEDQIGEGQSIDEIAKTNGLTIETVSSVDALGRGSNGQPARLPGDPRLLREIFATPAGAEPIFIDASRGVYFIATVDSITPPLTKTVDQVRGDIIASLKTEAAAKSAQTKAQALLERIKAGADIASIAREEGATLTTSAPVRRSGGNGSAIGPAATVALFNLSKPGDSTLAAASNGQDQIIMTLARVFPPNLNSQERAQLNQTVLGGLAEDYVATLRAALETRYKVEINRALLDQAIF